MSKRIDDGFSTIIAFDEAPSIKFYEKSVTPPSITGGGANDITTMRNTALRTKAPKKLKSMGDMSATVSYNPEVYDDCFAMINVNQEITLTFADGSTLVFWGWLDEFTPGASEEGSQPTADVTIICSNIDDDGAEIDPVLTASA